MAAALSAAGPPLMVTHDDDEQDDEEGQDELPFIGRFKTDIVGIRYYTGRVGLNEMVKLIREPHNPYDANAVRVENIGGEKVGHLNRHLAAQLAALLDSGLLRVEGVMPGHASAYTMPLDVYAFGDACVTRTLQQRLGSASCRLECMSLEQALDAMVAQQQGSQAPASGRRGARGSPSTSSRGGAGRAPTVVLAPAVMQDSLSRLFDDLHASAGAKPQMQAAAEVVSPLFMHQREALAWMVQRENSNGLPPFWVRHIKDGQRVYIHSLANYESEQRPPPLRGAVLADDMGLGKTLSIIALIATNRPGAVLPPLEGAGAPGARGAGAPAGPDEAGSSAAAAAAAAAAEGGERSRPAKRRKQGGKAANDPVSPGLVSGSQLGSAAQRAAAQKAAAAAEEAAWLAVEPPPSAPAANGPRGTLVVCPLTVLSGWQAQIAEHTAGNLAVGVYHGPERNRSRAWLASQDIVLTTYHTLAADLRNGKLGTSSGLGSIEWLRIVADEAHVIRNSKTKIAQACSQLRASRRWAVTGTPLQNNLTDVHGLCAFLDLKPLDDKAFWRTCIERPLKANRETALATIRLLMGSIALRRTKDTKGPDGRRLIDLPTRTVQLVQLQLGESDSAAYRALEEETRSLVAHHVASSTLTKNFTHVLAVLMRLRQVCCSSHLCPEALSLIRAAAAAAKTGGGQGDAPEASPELLAKLLAALAGEEGAEECAICLSPLERACITACGHIFCRSCIEDVIVQDKPTCPLCRSDIGSADLFDLPAAEQPQQAEAGSSGEGAGRPVSALAAAAALVAGKDAGAAGLNALADAIAGCSKLQALLARLREVEAEGKQAESDALAAGEPAPAAVKSVVFSQFMRMLDLAAAALTAEGISFVRVDGTSSAAARRSAIEAFSSSAPAAPRVFLASLRAAGVGTNLVAASEVHLLDPWWNPAVEDQAADRVHRLGQQRPVFVWRYVAQGTIEERMLELQERKAALAEEAGVGGGGGAARAGVVRDLGVRAADVQALMGL